MTMKFFNWMHSKLLHQSVVYSRVPQKQQQPDVFNDVKESEADEAVLLSNVLDGILSIGTLGINSNYDSSTQYEDDKTNKQDQHQEQEVEELVLPITTAAKQATKSKENEEKKKNVEMVVILAEKNNIFQNTHKEHMTEPLLKEYKEKESKRITLADLFAATDPLADKESLSLKEKPAKTKYIESKCKHNMKVVCRKKEEKSMPKINTITTSSTKQVKRLITKVMTKKVHPEMGVGGAMKEMEKISLVEERRRERD